MLLRTSRGLQHVRQQVARNSGYAYPHKLIGGNREIVCHGTNGNPVYIDTSQVPFPGIRYREVTPELMALREKERGDWKNLTIDEKKCLYRSSFRQTFSEFEAPSSEWKYVLGSVLMFISASFWLFIWAHQKVHNDWPASFTTEARIAQYYRMVDLNMAPITGLPRVPGAEKRVFPKNQKMLDKYYPKDSSE